MTRAAVVKPRVMVSSVVRGFEEAREAARNGIEAGGGEPLLVNEDFPALSSSPRNACLDAVDSSDALVVIIGSRAGFIAPSGKPVVEEEYERAVSRGIPIHAFVQEGVEREAEAARLEERISDYVGGHFRSSFHDFTELQQQVAAAVETVTTHLQSPAMPEDMLQDLLTRGSSQQQEPILRTAFAPIRDEEMIDAVEIGTDRFREDVLEIGMEREVQLFSAWHEKSARLSGGSLVIEQEARRRAQHRYARMQLSPRGLLVVESNVTGRQDSDVRPGLAGLQILEQDVVEVLGQHFSFASRLYEKVDSFRRQHAIKYNVALLGARHRTLVESPSTSGPVRMAIRGDQEILVHAAPRQIGRAVLAEPGPEIERTLVLLRRQMAD